MTSNETTRMGSLNSHSLQSEDDTVDGSDRRGG